MVETVPESANDDQGQKNNPSENQPGSTTSQNPNDSNVQTQGSQKPNRRQENPLSNFASYTYNLSLYMITPDAYDAFVLSGRKNLNVLNNADTRIGDNLTVRGGGAFLLAQSGGINNTTGSRANGFELDYYIDNLVIDTIPPNTSTRMSAGTTNITFNIIEPYGFSLVTNLLKASQQMEKYRGPLNPTKQMYILGIKFIGYDDQGRLLTGSEDFGGTLDPTNTGNGAVFEKYLDIEITEFKFRLDGKAVVYNVRAVARTDGALGTLRGFIKQSVKVSGPTVQEMLLGEKGLITALNALQQQYLDNGDIEEATTYAVEFDGPGAQAIAEASLITPNQNNEFSYTLSPNDVKSTEDSNELASFIATPNIFSAEISIVKQTSIAKVLEIIITRSTYLTDAMKILNSNATEPENGSLKTFFLGTKVNVAWFTVTPIVSNPRWDNKQNIWVYDITYKIRKYETPITLSPYVNPGIKYYGPHKKYDYWLTGNNREVISYESQFNNAFFTNIIAGAPESLQPANDTASVPIVVGSQSGGIKLGSVNGGQSLDFQNNFITTLYDPSATVTAKLQIIGDPDYINQGEVASVNTLFNKFYDSDSYTIAYGGGQTFIEINFYEGQDYDQGSGLFKINDKIVFYEQRNVESLVEGLSYQLLAVKHNFSAGKFTQILDLRLNNFSWAQLPDDFAARNTETAAPSGGRTADGTATGGDGIVQDKPPDQGPVNGDVNNSPTAPVQATIPVGNGDEVEDGDIVGINTPGFYDGDYDENGRDYDNRRGDPFGP